MSNPGVGLSRRGIGASGRGVAVLVLMLAACRGERAPAPVVVPDDAPPPPSTLSRFSVPLEYDFTSVLPVIERAVPLRLGSMDSVRQMGTDERKHYAFSADREAFTTVAVGNEVFIRTTLSYTARAFYKPPIGPTVSAGCGQNDERPRIVVELATPVSLRPDWHLATAVRLVRVGRASGDERDKCNATVLRLDMTEHVLTAARAAITAKLAEIDRKVGGVSLEPRMVEWWRTLNRPIRVADGVWLVLGAERLRAGRPSGQGHVLTIPVSLDAHPRIVLANAVPDVATSALPPLGRDSAGSGFRVTLDGTIDYPAASGRLRKAFAGKPFVRAEHTVYVTAVAVAPLDSGRLALDLTFDGDAVGTLRLTGRPVLDTARKEMTVPDLAYDLDTDNQIINTYTWLASDELRWMIRDRARIPFDDAVELARGLLVKGLNREIGKALTLTGVVEALTIQELFVTGRGLVVRAEATGQAGVAIRPR